jgi:hypothetical protein
LDAINLFGVVGSQYFKQLSVIFGDLLGPDKVTAYDASGNWKICWQTFHGCLRIPELAQRNGTRAGLTFAGLESCIWMRAGSSLRAPKTTEDPGFVARL